MLRVVVALVVATTVVYASNVDECRWGESYWCSGLENARACDAFGHCKSTVWKNQILQADDSEVCDFCKSIIEDVDKLIKDNRTQQDVLRFMKSACSVIPYKKLADECSKLVENFLIQFMEIIIDEVKPRSVCALIRLCSGFEDTVARSRLPEVPVVVQTEPNTKLSLPEIKGEPFCTDCKKFFTAVKNLIDNNATEAEIEILIDQELCSHLGTFETPCKDLVKAYLPEIIFILSTEFDPNAICESLGLCSITLKEINTFLVNLKLKASEFYKITSSETSDDAEDGCSICKTVMKDIQDLDRNAAVQRKIKEFLKLEICTHLGSYKTICDDFVEKYSEYVFELLANELDPESRCRALGFCVASNAVRDPTRESTPAKTSAAGQSIAETYECTMCKLVVKKVDDMIKQNASKQEIIEYFDKICSTLPGTMKETCLSFVSQYGVIVIDLLVHKIEPSVICSRLGLCNKKPRELPSHVSSTTDCVVCESVVQYVEALLQENATVTQIEALLEKVCNFVPKTIEPECEFVVTKYGPYLIQYIATAITPKAICEAVGACQTKTVKSVEMATLTEAKVVESSHRLLGAIECSRGPKYWCASRENAKACQATDYCNETGWER